MSDAACLVSVGDLPGKSLTDADDNILGVYQDWVHQNPGTHLDGKIEEDSKWQELWKKLVIILTHIWSDWKFICWNYYYRNLRNLGLPI